MENIIKKKRDRLKAISENYSLDHYTDEKNIPNQELVVETINYFETGPGARVFKPLVLLNLLEKQYQFVVKNWFDQHIVIDHLKKLPLDEVERHILMGLILKWLGGYPITPRSDFDERRRATKKAIEIEFLNYQGETPEKEFCKANNELRDDYMKLEIAFNANLNYGASVTDILKELGGLKSQQKRYSSFKELFQDAVQNRALAPLENEQVFSDKLKYLNTECRYLYEFNLWLQKTEDWELGDEEKYKTFLTKEKFLEFLELQYQKKQQRDNSQKIEAQSWKIRFPLPVKQVDISELQNNFDHITITEVYNHFKTGLVDKGYLSENDLLSFLNAAFDKQIPPPVLFTLQDFNTKQKIIRVFGDYYKKKAGKPYGKQKQYAGLLGKYFIGYKTENVSSNFSK